MKYLLFKNDYFEFDLGVGAFYEHEKWKNIVGDGSFIYNDMVKSSNYLKTNIAVSETTNLAFICFYQFGYDADIEAVRQRVSILVELELTISKRVSFILEGNIHHEDKPVIDINQTIYGLKNGLRFEF
jgi:hypothetical protein